MLHLGRNLVAIDTLGEVKNLAERGVAKLTTQVVMLLILAVALATTLLIAILLLQANDELILGI